MIIKNILVVEKYTSYEYTLKEGNINIFSKKRLDDLKESHNIHKEAVKSILEFLEKHSLNFKLIKDSGILKENYSNYDAIISLGGDGTALHAASKIKSQIFFGVNTDIKKSRGKLTTINKNNFKNAYANAINNQNINYWQRLIAIVNNKELEYLAINEILIADPRVYKTSHFNLEIDSNISHIKSNGIIISTPNGSTAIYQSSGGTCFEKGIGYSIIMPYSISNDFLKSSVFDIEKKIIIYPKREHFKLIFDCNEQRSLDLRHGDVIEVSTAIGKELKVANP